MKPYKHFVNNILFAFVAVLALQPQVAGAQQTKPAADSAFSFAVYGDSRSMMYLPYKSDQKAEATQADGRYVRAGASGESRGRGRQEGCQAHLRPGHQ